VLEDVGQRIIDPEPPHRKHLHADRRHVETSHHAGVSIDEGVVQVVALEKVSRQIEQQTLGLVAGSVTSSVAGTSVAGRRVAGSVTSSVAGTSVAGRRVAGSVTSSVAGTSVAGSDRSHRSSKTTCFLGRYNIINRHRVYAIMYSRTFHGAPSGLISNVPLDRAGRVIRVWRRIVDRRLTKPCFEVGHLLRLHLAGDDREDRSLPADLNESSGALEAAHVVDAVTLRVVIIHDLLLNEKRPRNIAVLRGRS
jgi:hypothetical protein